jgi:hypothetical protein
VSDELLELKKRFTLLNPNNLPKWVHLEAFALLEEYLRLWIYIGDDKEWRIISPDFGYPIHHPTYGGNWEPTATEYNRITELAVGCNKVFKSYDMRDSWEKVSRIFINDPVKSQAWFSWHLSNAFVNPHELVNSTAESQKSKSTLLRHLKKAQEAAMNLPTSLVMEWTKELTSVENEQGNHGHVFYPRPDGKIDNLITALERIEITDSIFPKSVHGTNSPRLFFMRSLTSAFISQTGKPYRKVVADAVSSAFDCSISEPEVVRATKGLPVESKVQMRAYQDLEEINNLNISALLKDPFGQI